VGRETLKRIQRHIGNLGSPDEDVAKRAEGCLMTYYGARALDLLTEACTHSNPEVRFRAASILGHTRDPRAYKTLVRLTRDADHRVRYDAAIALGILGDTRAIKPLVALMTKRDDKTSVDNAAARGLCHLGTAATPAVLPLLKSRKAHIRMAAADVLGGIGDRRAIQPLTVLLADKDPWTRIAGVEALAEIGTARCLALIRRRLNDPVQRVRENAAYWYREVAKDLRAARSRATRARSGVLSAR
jgi:HEAT repeat protein